MMEGSEVRILRGADHSSTAHVEPPPERSGPQAHVDHALSTALALAEQAQESAREAVDWLATVAPVKNRNVTVLIGQLVEEVKEVARLRG